MTATEFEAKCLAVLDEVALSGEVVTILKHGKPVAQLVPPAPREQGFPQETLRGTVEILGDIVEPVLASEICEVERSDMP